MKVTKTKHLEEWEIEGALPLDRIRIESDNEVESQITLFGVDGNIVEEVTSQQVIDEDCSDELMNVLELIGIVI